MKISPKWTKLIGSDESTYPLPGRLVLLANEGSFTQGFLTDFDKDTETGSWVTGVDCFEIEYWTELEIELPED